jgi:hypothetical protein
VDLRKSISSPNPYSMDTRNWNLTVTRTARLRWWPPWCCTPAIPVLGGVWGRRITSWRTHKKRKKGEIKEDIPQQPQPVRLAVKRRSLLGVVARARDPSYSGGGGRKI